MPETARPLILSVDDNAPARYARRRILQNAGYEVLDAANGQEALELLARRPQLVILDVGLPDIDGLEVCRRIKANPETAPIMVLQVSASFVKGSDQTRALEGGADNFVIEPVEPEVLVATVNALLRIRHAEDAVQRAAQEWAATFQAINEGVALLDMDGRIQRCNRAFAEFLGRPVESIEARSWDELLAEIAGDDRRSDASSIGTLEPRSSFLVGERWVQVGTAAFTGPAGSGGRRVLVLTDVTDHMKALTAAEDANRLKDEFLAVLSHELRTPLNAIVGWAKLLQMGQLGEAETTKALQTISRNAEAQNQLISDILDVSCIVAGKLRLEIAPMDLATVIDAAVDTVRPSALAKNIRVETAFDPGARRIHGDPGRLQQVVWNLVSNAIKFAPSGGQVVIRLLSEGADVLLVIEDNGPGVKPEFLPYAFDRFRQADSSSSRPKGGLGLGLAIVKHIVDLHSGSVNVQNVPEGHGARFTVRLPRESRAIPLAGAARAVRPATEESTRQSDGLRGVRVLVVDDEEDARSLVLTVLQQRGADVLTAASALEALPILERERPDVLLCDIEMAGDDGYVLLRRVRALPAARGGATPAIALTSYSSAADVATAQEAGFQAHVAKPVRPADLVGVVTSLARTR
jgi:signal transduction histidine kinase